MVARWSRVAMCAAALLCAGGGALGADVPARTESGLTLEVPADQTGAGTVFYVVPGQDVQITFTSDAPLERIVGTSDAVVGYAVLAPVEGGSAGAALVHGAFRLPAASFDTSIPERDAHLRSENWLNAAKFPDITFALTGAKDIKLVSRDDDKGFLTFEGTLVGDMTVHGVTKEVSIPARYTYMRKGPATKVRAEGNLLAIRCRFPVRLADYGVNGFPQILGSRLAEEVQVDEFLVLTDVSPQSQLEPREGAQDHGAKDIARFYDLLVRRKNADEAYAFGREAMKQRWEDARFLARLSRIAIVDDAARRDPAFALQAAERAVEISGGKDAMALNALAEVQYTTGDLNSAVETQRRAVENLGDAPAAMARTLRDALARYEAEAKAAAAGESPAAGGPKAGG